MSQLIIRTVGEVLYGQFKTPNGLEVRMRKQDQSWKLIRTLNPLVVWEMVCEHADKEAEAKTDTFKRDLASRFASQEARKASRKKAAAKFLAWRRSLGRRPAHEGD